MTSKTPIMSGRLWSKAFLLAVSKVFQIRGSTQLFLKLKVFMPEMNPNFI